MSVTSERGMSYRERWFQHVLLTISTTVILFSGSLVWSISKDVDRLVLQQTIAAEQRADHEIRLRELEKKHGNGSSMKGFDWGMFADRYNKAAKKE